MNTLTLRALRKQNGWTQREVADRLGVHCSTYTKYETGASEPSFDILQKLTEIFDVSADQLLGRPIRTKSLTRTLVPVLGNVAAGIPIEAITDIVDYEEIDAAMAKTGDFFGLRIKGASMEPRMREGDVVIVRKQDTAETGETVVVLVNGDSATVKKIKYGPDGITLVPTNPAYDVMFYSAAEVESLPVRVIGRVVELRAKY